MCSRWSQTWWVSCRSVCPPTPTSCDHLVWLQLVDLLTHQPGRLAHNLPTSLSGCSYCQVVIYQHYCAWLCADFDWLSGLEIQFSTFFLEQLWNHYFTYSSSTEKWTALHSSCWTVLRLYPPLTLALCQSHSFSWIMKTVVGFYLYFSIQYSPMDDNWCSWVKSCSLRHLLKQLIKSHRHWVSHRNLDSVDTYCREQPLGRQPNWLQSKDGRKRERMCVLWIWQRS